MYWSMFHPKHFFPSTDRETVAAAVNICGQAAEELQRQQEELQRPEGPAGSGRAWCPILGTCFTQWIGLRENLQETIDFPIKYRAFL